VCSSVLEYLCFQALSQHAELENVYMYVCIDQFRYWKSSVYTNASHFSLYTRLVFLMENAIYSMLFIWSTTRFIYLDLFICLEDHFDSHFAPFRYVLNFVDFYLLNRWTINLVLNVRTVQKDMFKEECPLSVFHPLLNPQIHHFVHIHFVGSIL
jgi:hypothetical protein